MSILLLSGLSSTVRAQITSAATGPSVQRLYTEAKTAAVSGDRSTAILKYEAILRIAPRLAPAYNNLGMLYCEERDFSKAAAVLEKGLMINPKMTSASALLGLAYSEMGEYQKARSHLEAVVRASPHDIHARVLLARDLINLKDYQSAEIQLRTLIIQDSGNQEAWYLLGKVYLQLSEAALGKVKEINPNSVLSHEIAGEVMESMNNFEGALVEYQKAVAMAPQQPGTHEHLANAFWAIGKWDSARKEFKEELANDPASCNARWKMANCLIEQNVSPDEALTELDAALKQCPNLIGAHVDRARAIIRAGRSTDALPDLFLAEKNNPGDPTVHFLLASVYRSQGRTADALTEMRTYSRLQQSAGDAIAKHTADIQDVKENAH